MPPKRRYRRKRRNVRPRRRRRGAPRPAISRNFLSAETAAIKHRYVVANLVTPDMSGDLTFIVYRGNSLFAPEVIGGHQPYGFDQMAQFFSEYQVRRARIKVEVSYGGVGTFPRLYVGIKPSVSNTLLGSIDKVSDIMETGFSPYKQLAYNSGNAQSLAVVTSTRNTTAMLDIKDLQDNHDTKAKWNSGPTSNWYFHLWLGAVDETSALGAVNIIVTIDYDAVWSERILLAES